MAVKKIKRKHFMAIYLIIVEIVEIFWWANQHRQKLHIAFILISNSQKEQHENTAGRSAEAVPGERTVKILCIFWKVPAKDFGATDKTLL